MASRIARSTAFLLVAVAMMVAAPLPGARAQDDASASPDETSAERRRDASARFRRGVTLYEEGDYEAAMIEFQRAYEALPSYHVLFNIGQTQLAMWHYVAALRAFEAYLEQGGEQIDPARRAQVEEAIATLRGRTGTLSIRVNVEGAEIRIDDDEAGLSPLHAPLLVDVGRHVVDVRAPEHEPWRQTVTIAGGETAELEVVLQPIPAAVVVAAPSAESHPVRTVGIAGLVLTGGLAIASVVTGVLATESHDRLQQQLGTFPGDRSAIESARSETSSLSLATDVMIASAIVLGGVSLALVIADSGGDEERETSVSLHVAPTGVAVRGSF